MHVLAALRVFRIDGSRDREFLERVFQRLLVNFTWWLNREDADGNNVFGGGFLGGLYNNISPMDRSKLPEGVTLEQADGTAWVAYYALSMLVMAVVLAEENAVYEDMVVKFLEQFLLIGRALEERGLYDPEDAFFYDRLGGSPSGGRGRAAGADDLGPGPAAARCGAAPAPGGPRRPAGQGLRQRARELGPAGRHPGRPGARASTGGRTSWSRCCTPMTCGRR